MPSSPHPPLLFSLISSTYYANTNWSLNCSTIYLVHVRSNMEQSLSGSSLPSSTSSILAISSTYFAATNWSPNCSTNYLVHMKSSKEQSVVNHHCPSVASSSMSTSYANFSWFLSMDGPMTPCTHLFTRQSLVAPCLLVPLYIQDKVDGH